MDRHPLTPGHLPGQTKLCLGTDPLQTAAAPLPPAGDGHAQLADTLGGPGPPAPALATAEEGSSKPRTLAPPHTVSQKCTGELGLTEPVQLKKKKDTRKSRQIA